MRIVDRETFLALPAGTVFCKFEPDIFGNLEIKGDSTTNAQGALADFWAQDLAGAIKAENTAKSWMLAIALLPAKAFLWISTAKAATASTSLISCSQSGNRMTSEP